MAALAMNAAPQIHVGRIAVVRRSHPTGQLAAARAASSADAELRRHRSARRHARGRFGSSADSESFERLFVSRARTKNSSESPALTITFGRGKSECSQNDWEILEGEILHGHMEPMPVVEGRRDHVIALHEPCRRVAPNAEPRQSEPPPIQVRRQHEGARNEQLLGLAAVV